MNQLKLIKDIEIIERHSKGEWQALKNDSFGEDHKILFKDRSGYVICHRNRNELLTLATVSGYFKMTQREIEANAKLIAAAPDLLEALEICLESLSTYGQHPIIEEIAKKALLKAKP